MKRLPRIFFAALFILLTACGTVPTTAVITPAPPQTEVFIPTDTESIENTPVLPEIAEAPLCTTADCIQPTSTEPPPLQMVLPTPGAEPVSAWRPPLYPVPWAISPNDHFYFTRPIAADVVNWPLEDYRYGGIFAGTNMVHTGIDIPAKYGTPVIAAGSGMVVWAGWGLYSGAAQNKKDPYGQAVVIRHDFGYNGLTLYSVYAHLSEIDVSRGQWVKDGEQVGLVGTTGFTTGPHLHFEIRIGENDYFTTRNPELWLAPPQGWGILVGRVMNSGGLTLKNQLVVVESLENGQRWRIRTYGPEAVHSDEYYRENLVLSDLPAGRYLIYLPTYSSWLQYEVEIHPGEITYFTMKGYHGFTNKIPPMPGMESLTPTPKSR
jgi:hypothetical protein